jgi:hypothetical protein
MKRIQLFVIALTAALICACGGGGSSSRSSTPVVSQPSTPTISITTTGLHAATQNQPFSDAIGVNTTSTFTVSAQGALPPGLSVSSSGSISGTPTQTGLFPITFTATSSTNSAVTTSKSLTIQVVTAGTVRNDTLAAATQLACCGTISASLSPYSKASGVAAPDQDYYQITANPSDRISIDAVAIGTAVDTDTVIEILDANGARMNVCKTPQATASFTNACLNDDINPGVIRNSHLDIQLPATSGVFVVHVLDWAGRARPEMTYELRTVKLP